MNLLQEVLKYGASKAFPVEKVDEATQQIRFAVCKACENYDPMKEQCQVCGCFMQIKTGTKTHRNPVKLRIEVTHCPLGKWGENDKKIANYYRQLDGKQPLNNVSQTT